MNENPMIAEVCRLVGDRLAAGETLALPGVGSLAIERRGARRISRRRVEPPYRAVVFSSQLRGTPLTDAIAAAAKCDAATARQVYDRWLEAVGREHGVRIDGVGELKFKHFTPDPAFDRVLNPQGHVPVRVSSGGDWVMWVGVCAIVAAIAIGGFGYSLYHPDLFGSRERVRPAAAGSGSERAASDADRRADALPGAAGRDNALSDDSSLAATGTAAADKTAADKAAADKTAADKAAAERGASAPTVSSEHTGGSERAAAPGGADVPAEAPSSKTRPAAGTPDAPARLVSGRHYAVIGVYSAPENTARAIREAAAKDPSLRCSVYRFGSKWMVSPFDAADADACAAFIREWRTSFPGLWTYTAR